MQHQLSVSFDVTIDSEESIEHFIDKIRFVLISNTHDIVESSLEDIEYMGSREKDDEPFTMEDW